MGAGLRLEAEPARQVRVEHVEAARAQPELARLRVDEHLVAQRHGAGEARVGDARVAVDLEADEARVPLADGGDVPRRRPSGIYAARAASTSASVTSTIASRSATAMCSSDEWMFAMPLPRFTHCRPRSLKTFASAPPPVRM